jgi:uncharacterized iron-regulated membrane protein
VSSPRKRQAQILRTFRKVHRTTGAFLFVIFFIVSISGLLLGWKKHSGGTLLPKSYVGTSTDLKDWLPLDSLQTRAFTALRDSVSPDLSLDLQRIDARPEKGMIKFVFDQHYWGIQLDGATGEVLKITRRRHDLVENIHDGSIMDIVLGTGSETLKLIYTSIVGSALFTFTVTGFWLWYGPKRMIRAHRRRAEEGDG